MSETDPGWSGADINEVIPHAELVVGPALEHSLATDAEAAEKLLGRIMYNFILGFGYWTLVQYLCNSPRRCHLFAEQIKNSGKESLPKEPCKLRAIVIDYADVIDHDVVNLPILSDLVEIILITIGSPSLVSSLVPTRA